jgi:hypothetical protein
VKQIQRRGRRGPYSPRKAITPIGPSIAYIPLTRGQFALVDAEDAGWLSASNWYAKWDVDCSCFYAATNIPELDGRFGYASMHTSILGLVGTGLTADHLRPGNGLDNRRANLRSATAQQQAINHRLQRNSTTGHRGVTFNVLEKKWKAHITHFRKRIHLGTFATLEAAQAAYRAKAREIQGEFARVEVAA